MKQKKMRQGRNSRRGSRVLRGLLVSVLALGLTAGLSGFGDLAAETAGEQVRRVELQPEPGWSISGVWSEEGDSLLLVDAFRSQVLEYSTSGELLHSHEVPLRGSTMFSRPSQIQPWPGGYIVEQEDAGFVVVDAGFDPRREVDLLAGSAESAAQAHAIFLWTPLGSDRLVALGDAQMADGTWKTGLFLVSLNDPSQLELLTELEDEDALDVYLVGLDYLASLGDRGYFVEMWKTPPQVVEVRRLDDGRVETRRLSIFPETAQAGRAPFLRPYLSEASGLNQLPKLYAEIERSFMVSGIYGWEDHLYLLVRRPDPGVMGSRWSLTKVDPERETIVGQIELPTTAAHVTLIPGTDSWAVLEKGKVRGFGRQEIPSVLLIPSSHFR